MKIVFVHPDLGIGGAERLVIDAALGLASKRHSVVIYTSHFDPNHAFAETSGLDIHVVGDWLPRSLFGAGFVLFAWVRSLWLCLSLVLVGPKVDAYIVDQISIGIPLLRLTGQKILFYCHYPDKCLSIRETWIKTLYRIPFDTLEETTTKMADAILVNSKYTRGVFSESFNHIKRIPEVLYPGIQLASYDKPIDLDHESVVPLITKRQMILSINRFERKKNIALALHAFGSLKSSPEIFLKSRLVIAGGYDSRVTENLEHLQELKAIAQEYGLETCTLSPTTLAPVPSSVQVLFLLSFTEEQRTFLLKKSTCLVYTPSNEHFGIVPLEAMYAGLPVIAVNSGGPTETVLDGITGYLVPPTATEFAARMKSLLSSNSFSKAELKRHVAGTFSLESFTERLEMLLNRMNCSDNLEAIHTFEVSSMGFSLVFLGIIFTIISLYSSHYIYDFRRVNP